MALRGMESESGPRWRTMGRAFANRNYRLFFAGQGVSLVGTWMTRLATSWLIYRLAGGDAPWLLGVVGFAGLAPTFFLGPVAGVFVDRWDRHRVLVVTQILSLLQSAALAGVAFHGGSGSIMIGLVVALSLAQGAINAFDMPARQSLMIEMVGRREDLPSAIALNSSLVNGARLVGPALAGMVIALVGEAWCFAIDAISYVGVVAALLAMRLTPKPRPPATGSVFGRLTEGARYAFGFPPIRALLLLLAQVSFATMPQSVLMPVFVARVLGGGPYTLGLLSASQGCGALAGALYLASRPSVLGLGRVVVGATLVLSLGLLGFSQSSSVWLSAVLIAAVGAGMMAHMAATNTLIQTMVDEDKRGRVMGFYGMAFQGVAPFGSLLGGWLAGRYGSRPVVLGAGLVVMAGGLTFATQLPRLRRHARPLYKKLGILPSDRPDEVAAVMASPPALRETA
ncbi:MFS transporter [Paludisphaera rhizosphaerae]|uniref:MFS transporter n=2 Tax=Paludisphaera rhizosphaerae TaxID=2711216 RepID=UPI00197EC854|nr:MFS transporter [Paludisphaera rhizosphaerae]